MQKRIKRVQKNIDSQQQEIVALLSALNGEWHRVNLATRKLLLRVVPDAGRLARIVLKLQNLVINPPRLNENIDSKTLLDFWEDLSSPATRHLSQLNDQLRQYRTFPHISLDRGGWHFQWNVAYSGDVDGGVIDARTVEELPLVLTAIRLAEQSLIDRVRRCPIDRRWFYARTKESRFCRSKCRNMFHQEDPKDKERRRKWARENYQSRKELELGSRNAAQPKGRKR